jgi:hypothetical protein
MTNQLTVRIDAENGFAVVSRFAAVHSRTLAVAAAAGSQFLAFTAAATHEPGHEVYVGETPEPIVYPEGVIIVAALSAAAGAFAGAALATYLFRKR